MQEDVLKEILLIEWDMFKNVTNQGGEAPCQRNQKTFVIMRLSQAMSWNEAMLESYLQDLKTAKAEGRNIMTEKYARMMKYTFPEEYEKLEHSLPAVSGEKQLLADRITALMVCWARLSSEKYPYVTSAGRPIGTMEDNQGDTSIETYFRGELLTYGTGTLQLCWEHYSKSMAQGVNSYETVLKNMVKLYGYDSIEQAEEYNRKRTKSV